MLRVTKDNLDSRHEDFTNSNSASILPSTYLQNTTQLRRPEEFGQRIFTNKRSGLKKKKKRHVQNNFHTLFPILSQQDLKAPKRQADLGSREIKSFLHLSFGQQKRNKNINMVVFRLALWSSNAKLS